MEAQKHAVSSFVTLTYDDDNLPKDESVDADTVQDWLKRLRSAIAPRRIRYYLVGEYGPQTCRPHYHAVVFGLNPTEDSGIVASTWGLGFTTTAELTRERAAYVAGYVTEKIKHKKDVRLADRRPEFQRMSLRPHGIGAGAMEDVAAAIKGYGSAEVLQTYHEDVPFALKIGGSNATLGRYLRRKLREQLGMSPDAPEKSKKIYGLTMRAVYEEALEAKENKNKGPAKIFIDMTKQKINNLVTRSKIFGGKKSI